MENKYFKEKALVFLKIKKSCLYNLAEIHKETSQPLKAIFYYSQYLELEPENRIVIKELIHLCALSGIISVNKLGCLEETIYFYKRILCMQISSSERLILLARLAKFCYFNQDYDEAVEYLSSCYYDQTSREEAIKFQKLIILEQKINELEFFGLEFDEPSPSQSNNSLTEVMGNNSSNISLLLPNRKISLEELKQEWQQQKKEIFIKNLLIEKEEMLKRKEKFQSLFRECLQTNDKKILESKPTKNQNLTLQLEKEGWNEFLDILIITLKFFKEKNDSKENSFQKLIEKAKYLESTNKIQNLFEFNPLLSKIDLEWNPQILKSQYSTQKNSGKNEKESFSLFEENRQKRYKDMQLREKKCSAIDTEFREAETFDSSVHSLIQYKLKDHEEFLFLYREMSRIFDLPAPDPENPEKIAKEVESIIEERVTDLTSQREELEIVKLKEGSVLNLLPTSRSKKLYFSSFYNFLKKINPKSIKSQIPKGTELENCTQIKISVDFGELVGLVFDELAGVNLNLEEVEDEEFSYFGPHPCIYFPQ